ncbi:MAG: hypothetical protein GKR96_08035 [Gammaproteobacteria bacterium]|nr:hypothetical protein [Gammaproteobacteria bacterium]
MSIANERFSELTHFIQAHSCQWSYQPTEGEWGIHHLDDPPPQQTLGPVFERGEACGLIAIGGEIQCQWGDIALLRLWKRPLPEVFAEYIMQPLGASKNWQWHGYDNSWAVLDDGQHLQSVPGGGHWGGGMVISAHDQYLVAKLMLDQGQHAGQKLLSADWIQQMVTPAAIAPWYGYFTWLNTGHVISPEASESSYFAMGIGGQMVWHDPVKDRVVVLR